MQSFEILVRLWVVDDKFSTLLGALYALSENVILGFVNDII